MTVTKIKIILLILEFARLTCAFNYRSKLVSQRITHFENPYVGFDVKYYGDEGYPYLILKEDITPYNDLHLMLYARVYDQAPNFLANAPISLCQLLHDEQMKKNETMMQFNIPQIYNFVGQTCPIEQDRVRLSPYVFPANFMTDVDLGCGYMNLESRLMKCNNAGGSENRSCETLLKTVTIVFLLNESCEADEKDVPGWTDIRVA